MLSLFTILLCLLAAFYFIILIMLMSGLFRLQEGTVRDQPFITVVIAARNEEDNIGSCLESLAVQDYPKEKHEIIVVNDRSLDNTAAVIEGFIEKDGRFRLVDIREKNPDMAPKKWALHKGIGQAKGDIIFTTDGDCTVSPGWISSIVRYFERNVGLVAGFSPLNRISSSSIFYRWIRLDGLALAGVAAGSFGAGFPLTCNGRNLAYRKSVYEDVGGFHSISRFASGDDDLFLHLVRKKTKWKMRYAIDKESVVPSRPPSGLKTFFYQRTRHASKGRHYPIPLTLGLLAVYLFNLLLLISLVFLRFWPLFALLFGAKALFELILVWKAARIFHQKSLLQFFPLGVVMHMFYVVFFGLWGQVGSFKWKE